MVQLEHLLFGRWEPVSDDTVRCLYCGSTDVSCKSKRPRPKRYVDAYGHEQTVEVYRYYCHNPECKHKTFTNLPPNLLPYSKWTVERHSAQLYLGVFEKVYRFTPFSNDAQERIRDKCPLELAGHEIRKLPICQLFRGLTLQWPEPAFRELVPNV